ncbi:cytochrome P450 [Aquihabitans sp. McL0605]|uniref:cytochrome P450 n=1 Tax=Aquihabitans sp. McL0605 TaxID=3415671 RepID=UPI003CEA79D1
MAAATVPTIDANTLDPRFWVDIDAMHGTFRAARRNGPLAWDATNRLWVVLGHREIQAVEGSSEVFVSGQGYRSFFAEGEDNMISLDDPRHADQRKLVARRFTPKAVRQLEGYLRELIGELIDGFASAGELEVVSQLAAPLPARLTAHLLGFPEDRWYDIQTWSERLMRYDQALTDLDAAQGFIDAIGEFSAVLFPTEAARKLEPQDDLVSVWANAEAAGCPYTAQMLVNETGLVISGGAETTRTVISRGLAVLAEHPDQWEAMAADPALVPGAVEELIRWVTPLNNFFRTATADTEVAGVPIAAGDRVMLAYPSANRDERVFTDPDRFDIRRHPNPHVAFGFGTHFCLGASLARYELTLLFTELSRRFTDLQVTQAPDIEANIFVGAVRSLGLSFTER